MALIFYFEKPLAAKCESIIFAARNPGLYWIAKESSYKFGYFLKRFDKDPPVGNASRV